MRRAQKVKTGKIRPGDRVTVRPFEGIRTTLDTAGALEGLPFLPEMLKYCGRTFTVRRRVEKLIQEGVGSSMRRIKDVVLLEGTVCDGHSHGDCRRACFPLWKTAWLGPVQSDQEGALEAAAAVSGEGSGAQTPLLPSGHGCQVTALLNATKPLPLWHPMRHFLDLTARTYSPREYLAYVLSGIYKKTIRKLWRKNVRKGGASPGSAPDAPLDLKPEDLVEVKSAPEIQATLDTEGRHRGLYFMPGMWAYCRCRIRVLHPIDRMMSEKTGEMRALSRTVILEGITCDGKAHGGCQRGCLVFWKDAWLKRVGTD